MAQVAVHEAITRRGPRRSTRAPSAQPPRAYAVMWVEKTAEVAVRLDPNSCRKAGRNTEKACRGPAEIAHDKHTTPATTHP